MSQSTVKRTSRQDEMNAQERRSPSQGHEVMQDIMACLRDYAREKPEVVALWCLGIGFVLGWKLKPW
jgi:hypothetical protein